MKMINPLLPELIELQRKDGYLKPQALHDLSERLNLPLNRIYSVASFYEAFRFTPRGKHHIKVCIGAACYVKGAEGLFEAFLQHLQIPKGDDTSPDKLFTVSRVACLGCCMLAVAIEIDRHIFGHVTPEGIPKVLEDFLTIAGSESSHVDEPNPDGSHQSQIRICRCSSCRAAGSAEVFKAFNVERTNNNFDFAVKEVSCDGMSYRAPGVTVACNNRFYHYDHVAPHDARVILAEHFSPEKTAGKAIWEFKVFFDRFYSRKNLSETEYTQLDRFIDEARLITTNSGITHPESLDDYLENDGLVALEKIQKMDATTVIDLLKTSKLRGRGGGGFPTGEKWKLALEAPGDSRVVICNADEGDPGAFMDRMLLESFPFRVLEGILIASSVLNADIAIIYIRDEYTQAVSVLEKSIATLKERNCLKGFREGFDLVLFKGAGAFVCGEETALLESIEGKRGIPRRRPPFPVTQGLNGLPTLVNNVETLACIPMIIADEGARFNATGTDVSHGTKAFALAGKVKNGGLIEVPIGISIRDIVEKFGGGAEEGHTVKAVMIGGPSGGCIGYDSFDLPVDYETLQAKGAMMGSGGLIVLNEWDCMVDISLYFLTFLRDESCGKCTMCREGVITLWDLVKQLTTKDIKEKDLLQRIESLARHIQTGSLCALGRTAPNMVLSALHEFREEFEAHLNGFCPAGKCVELTEFTISSDCIGCTKCAQACATDAIECVPLDRAWIDQEKCVRCGVCRTVCPQDAIDNARGSSFKADSINDKDTTPTQDTSPVETADTSGKRLEGDVISVDGVEYPFIPDRTLLEYGTDKEWTIPTLCYLKGINENAHCMVCAVWDEIPRRFVPACEQLVERGHRYQTDTKEVRDFRKDALSLMLSRHDFTCGSCSAKGNCRFFDLIVEYKVKKKKPATVSSEENQPQFPEKIVTDHLVYDEGKCILCHRCISVSEDLLTVHHRGRMSCISPTPESWSIISKPTATKLDEVCPTGALSLNKRV